MFRCRPLWKIKTFKRHRQAAETVRICPAVPATPPKRHTPAFPHPPANKTPHKSGRTFATGEKFLHRHIFLFFAKTDRHAGASPAKQHLSSLPLMLFQQRHNRHPPKKTDIFPGNRENGKTDGLSMIKGMKRHYPAVRHSAPDRRGLFPKQRNRPAARL